MSKKQNKNKRAFTLTELLIVVIVIGVLSAVTLPKFTRVIENRKVTEAEEMMSAVRTEQERRCAMDKNYTLKFDNLSDVISSSKTKNYNYSLEKEGISAQSNKGNYTLKMLSYQDGSFCCTGADCGKLNKNYPSCDGLTFPSSGCSGTDGTVEVTPSQPDIIPDDCLEGREKRQTCNGCGTQTTHKCIGGKWVEHVGQCSKTASECVKLLGCTDGQTRGIQTCNNGCGTQTTQKCVGGKWVSQLGQCSKTVAECTGSKPSEEGKKFTCLKSFTWKVKGETPAPSARWTRANWNTEMVLGKEQIHHNGVIKCEPKTECKCTPGTEYLYYQTYECGSVPNNKKYGYYGATCGEVKSLDQCGAPDNMNDQPCLKGGSNNSLGHIGSGGSQNLGAVNTGRM